MYCPRWDCDSIGAVIGGNVCAVDFNGPVCWRYESKSRGCRVERLHWNRRGFCRGRGGRRCVWSSVKLCSEEGRIALGEFLSGGICFGIGAKERCDILGQRAALKYRRAGSQSQNMVVCNDSGDVLTDFPQSSHLQRQCTLSSPFLRIEGLQLPRIAAHVPSAGTRVSQMQRQCYHG